MTASKSKTGTSQRADRRMAEQAVEWCGQDAGRTLLDWTEKRLQVRSRNSPGSVAAVRRALKLVEQSGSFTAEQVAESIAVTRKHDGSTGFAPWLPNETAGERRIRRMAEQAVEWCQQGSDRTLLGWTEKRMKNLNPTSPSAWDAIRKTLETLESNGSFTADEVAEAIAATYGRQGKRRRAPLVDGMTPQERARRRKAEHAVEWCQQSSDRELTNWAELQMESQRPPFDTLRRVLRELEEAGSFSAEQVSEAIAVTRSMDGTKAQGSPTSIGPAVEWCSESEDRTLVDWTEKRIENLSLSHPTALDFVRRILRELEETGSFTAEEVAEAIAFTRSKDGTRPTPTPRQEGESSHEASKRRWAERAVKWCADDSDRTLAEWVTQHLESRADVAARHVRGTMLKRPEITETFTPEEIAEAVKASRLADGSSPLKPPTPNPIPADRLAHYANPEKVGSRITGGSFAEWIEGADADPSNSDHLAAFTLTALKHRGLQPITVSSILQSVDIWLAPDWKSGGICELTRKPRAVVSALKRKGLIVEEHTQAPVFATQEILAVAETLTISDRAYRDWCQYRCGQLALQGATADQIDHADTTFQLANGSLTVHLPPSRNNESALTVSFAVRPFESPNAERLVSEAKFPAFSQRYRYASDQGRFPPSDAGRDAFARRTTAKWGQRAGLRAAFLIEYDLGLRFGSGTTLRSTSPHCQQLDSGGYKFWTVDKKNFGYKHLYPEPESLGGLEAFADYLSIPGHRDYLMHRSNSEADTRRTEFHLVIYAFKEELDEVVPGFAANSIRASKATDAYLERENVFEILDHADPSTQHLYIRTKDSKTGFGRPREYGELDFDLPKLLAEVEELLEPLPPTYMLKAARAWVDELPDRDWVAWVQWRMLDPDGGITAKSADGTVLEHAKLSGDDVSKARSEIERLIGEGYGASPPSNATTTYAQIAEQANELWEVVESDATYKRTPRAAWKAIGFLSLLWLQPRTIQYSVDGGGFDEPTIARLLYAAGEHRCEDPLCLGRWLERCDLSDKPPLDTLMDTKDISALFKHRGIKSPALSVKRSHTRAAHETGMFVLDMGAWKGYKTPNPIHTLLTEMGLDPEERKNPGTPFPGCTLGHEYNLYPPTATPENKRPQTTAEDHHVWFP